VCEHPAVRPGAQDNPSAGAISIYWKWRQTRDSADRFDPRFFLTKKATIPGGWFDPEGVCEHPGCRPGAQDNPSAGAISIYWKWRQTRDSADRFDPRFFSQKKQPFPEGGSTPEGV